MRSVKVGISSNLASTLRTYHRRVPTDAFIVIVDCGGAARALERELLSEFAAMRIDDSEVLRVRIHEITNALRRRGYARDADSIFRRSTDHAAS